MASQYKKCLIICQAAGVISLLLGSLLIAALNQTENNAVNEECIRCHITIFNQGIANSQLHAPFWERQCLGCHMAEGASWSTQASQSSKDTVTGMVVAQEELWRKIQIYTGATGPVFEQLVKIPFPDISTSYRFRIVVSPLTANVGGEVHQSLWLGLQPEELGDSGLAGQVDVSNGLVAPVNEVINTASLYRNDNTVFIAWETPQLFYGWVELQELEGLSLTDLSATETESLQLTVDSGQHPPLRDPEDLAINACYQCHPESTLGTSHPVRLYSGWDVRIPDDLPTVDGMLTCVTCHDPHGSEGKMLVRETIKTKLCVACHFKFKNSSPSTMFD
ncbi:cytochrome c3 family protein [Sulfuriflexus sp.]|uniref:cytochrome c3 family protein n=1 Tax=Sulfuriflexus sp. TaxID=2015443 RepID=UPI0028CD2C8C|nr:cytochrome c3 family protein [Sulfuriflexus sp.]MDT8405436.1 cytochrome c3 family protein [Sulfuriflexus sp.]